MIGIAFSDDSCWYFVGLNQFADPGMLGEPVGGALGHLGHVSMTVFNRDEVRPLTFSLNTIRLQQPIALKVNIHHFGCFLCAPLALCRI